LSSTESGGGNRLLSPTRGRGAAPHRPTLASSLVAALVAVGAVLLFVLLRTGGTNVSSNERAPSTASSPTTPTTTGATSTAAGTAACTADEVHVVTRTNRSFAAPGAPITVTTLLRARATCTLVPTAVAPYGCSTTIVVVDALDRQVWPSSGQQEVCSTGASILLRRGVAESVRVTWDGLVHSAGTSAAAPPGTYEAVGSWAWSPGPGQSPTEVSARSAPFAIG